MRRDSSLTCTVLMHAANCKKLIPTSLVQMYNVPDNVFKYFMILSAWLNLDLGMETCFASHLDMFWKVLQFAFPLHIWLPVAAIILLINCCS